MIAYYVIVAVLLIRSHSTNDYPTFCGSKTRIEDHLLAERPISRILGKTIAKKLSSGEQKDIVCDVLDQDEKRLICDEMRQHLFNYNNSGVFELFVETTSSHAVPQIVDFIEPYTCKEISIENLSMEKRMFWCESRWYSEIGSSDYVEMPGFFCAGSRRVAGRVYAFRRSQTDSQGVSPVGEMDDVPLILTKDPLSSNERTAASFSDDDYVSLDTDLLLS